MKNTENECTPRISAESDGAAVGVPRLLPAGDAPQRPFPFQPFHAAGWQRALPAAAAAAPPGQPADEHGDQDDDKCKDKDLAEMHDRIGIGGPEIIPCVLIIALLDSISHLVDDFFRFCCCIAFHKKTPVYMLKIIASKRGILPSGRPILSKACMADVATTNALGSARPTSSAA